MKNNYGLRRLFSVCLVITLFFSLLSQPGFEVHAQENNFKKVTFSLDSNVIHNSSIDLYLHEDVYYISIDDLCSLTRCSQSEEDGIISINQGFWSAEFDINAQTFDDGYQKVDTTILEISKNKYAVPAVMFLNYFKASVAFIEGNKLFCKMPEFTAWEALDVNFKDTLIDIYELYGGEGNVELSLWLDIIMDFIMGDMADSEKYLSDAFVAALEVEINDNDSVKDYKETMVQKLYSELHSNQSKDFLESLQDTLSISAEPTEWYIQSYYNSVERSFVNLAYDAYEAGNYDEIKNYGKGFFDAFAKKNKVSKGAEEFFNNMDYLMIFISAASETAKEMKYVNATNDLIYNVMGQDNLQYLGISADDNLWFTVANKYQNVLNVGKKQLESEIMNFFIDKSCWETAIGGAVTNITGVSKGSWTLALSASRIIAKNINPITKGIIDGFEADRRGLYLSELQQNVFWVLDNTAKKFDGQLDNKDIYEKYIQAEQLYCRTSIAMYENLIKMVNQFGKDSDYWTDYFQKRIDMLSISLYQLTSIQDDGVINCLPLDLSTFQYTDDHKKSNEIEIYTQYLLSDGYCELMGHEVKKEYLEISSCLIDIDDDDIDELLISLMDTEFSGPRGYQTYTALLDIQDNVVKTIKSAYYGGGTMGGDYLILKYDQKNKKYVLALDGLIRDSLYANTSYLCIYSNDVQKVEWEIMSNYYNLSLDMYAETADKIRNETDLFYVNEESFRFYKINNEYVAEEEYATIIERFIDPVDSTYQMQLGTYDIPISSKEQYQ